MSSESNQGLCIDNNSKIDVTINSCGTIKKRKSDECTKNTSDEDDNHHLPKTCIVNSPPHIRNTTTCCCYRSLVLLEDTAFIALENCSCLDDTPFATKTELTADYQGSRISFVSDEFFGAANNLIKTSAIPEKKKPGENDNEEDGVQNGWLVKRHEPKAYVTIKLGVPGTISGVNIDTTGYTQCAPITVAIDGHLKNSPVGQWTTVLPDVLVEPNSPNYFQITCSNDDIFTHVHITTTPGGGIFRIRCFGDVESPTIPYNKTVNLASCKLGAQIIQKPRDVLNRDVPNLILSRSNSCHDGWITPRNNSQEYQSEYTVIKLTHEGTIERIVIDTKHFIGNAPKSITVEGCSMAVDQLTNQNTSRHVCWINLINNESGEIAQNIFPNMSQIFSCTYRGPLTHIRVRPVPDGGIQQVLVKGKVFLRDANHVPLTQIDSPSTTSSKKRKIKHDEHNDNFLKKSSPLRQSVRLKARSTQKPHCEPKNDKNDTAHYA